MPMIYKDVKTTLRKVVGFECSCCKRKFGEDDIVEMQEALHWRSTGGYGSVWGDGNTVEISLCQTCTLTMFDGIATVH